jgi:uncharacterized protein
MPSALILVAVGLIALAAGLAIGWILAGRKRSKRDVIIDLETRLERALESRADYEADVAEHFAETAQLLNKLTNDYRAVYSHLASGAEKLCDGEVNISSAALENVTETADIPAQLVDVMQPLDYAPRKTPDEQGQLSETFGLEKTQGDAIVLGETKKAG